MSARVYERRRKETRKKGAGRNEPLRRSPIRTRQRARQEQEQGPVSTAMTFHVPHTGRHITLMYAFQTHTLHMEMKTTPEDVERYYTLMGEFMPRHSDPTKVHLGVVDLRIPSHLVYALDVLSHAEKALRVAGGADRDVHQLTWRELAEFLRSIPLHPDIRTHMAVVHLSAQRGDPLGQDHHISQTETLTPEGHGACMSLFDVLAAMAAIYPSTHFACWAWMSTDEMATRVDRWPRTLNAQITHFLVRRFVRFGPVRVDAHPLTWVASAAEARP